MTSYGIPVGAVTGSVFDFYRDLCIELRAAVPAAHVEFLTGLQMSFETGDFFFAHAGVCPGVPLAEQDNHDLMWIRDAFLDHEGALEKIIVHGHTPTERPEVRKHRICIDIGAFMADRLTALALFRTERRFLET